MPGTGFLAVANDVVARAVAYGEEHSLRIAAVVLDTTFTPVAIARMDGAFPSTVTVATAKARTALNFGAPSHVMRDRITRENQTALTGVEPGLMFVGGGVPIVRDGRTVGALGISGGRETDDEACAAAACG